MLRSILANRSPLNHPQLYPSRILPSFSYFNRTAFVSYSSQPVYISKAPTIPILSMPEIKRELCQPRQVLSRKQCYFFSSKGDQGGNDETKQEGQNQGQGSRNSSGYWTHGLFSHFYQELLKFLQKSKQDTLNLLHQYRKRLAQTLLGCIAIHGESETAFFTSIADSLRQNLQEQREVDKGKAIQKIINKKLKQQSEKKDWSEALFQCEDYSYKNSILELLNLDDNKLMVFIQTLKGSGVASNLKKEVLKIIYPRADKKAGQGNEKSWEKDEKVGKKLFDNLFYINLCHPEIYSVQKLENSSLPQIKDLNALLNSIIGKSQSYNLILKLLSYIHKPFYKSSQKSVLIIDDVQILQQYLISSDQAKKKQIQEVYKKLKFIQAHRNVRVFAICNNSTFLHHLSRFKAPILEDFKYQLIAQMTEKDVREIIKSRMAITTYYNCHKQIAEDCSQYYQKLLDYAASYSTNIREIMRVLKMVKVDIKSQLLRDFQKKAKSQEGYIFDFFKSKQVPQSANEKIKNMCQVYKQTSHDHFNFLLSLKSKINDIYSRINEQKRVGILNQLDLTNQKNQFSEEMKKEVIRIKARLLLLIFAGRFRSQGNQHSLLKCRNQLEEQFVLKMTPNELIAYRELNEAEIIHNLTFSSKTYEWAFYHLLTTHNDHFKDLMGSKQDKKLVDSHLNFKEKIQKIERDLKCQEDRIRQKLKMRQEQVL